MMSISKPEKPIARMAHMQSMLETNSKVNHSKQSEVPELKNSRTERIDNSRTNNSRTNRTDRTDPPRTAHVHTRHCDEFVNMI